MTTRTSAQNISCSGSSAGARVLLGLLHEHDTAAQLLDTLGADLDQARQQVIDSLP